MNNLFDLTGKVAIVTGGNRGLGQGMALALAKNGAKIVSVSYGDSAETVKLVEELGGEAIQIDVNLMKLDSIDKVINTTKEAFGRIDILVNNAGMIVREDILDFQEKSWDDVMQLNLKTVFFLTQAVCKEFIAQDSNGKVINIASMLSFQGGIRVPSYTASKSGIAGITKSFANELAIKNINVNAIAPGYMATLNTQQIREDVEREKAIVARIPAGRWGTIDDLSGTVVFLASSASDYVNGAIIPVDGGWLAR